MAQIHYALGEWEQGINALSAWFNLVDKPDSDAYVLLAQGYYQLNRYDLALDSIETAISMYENQGNIPDEPWYNLARYLYHEKGDAESLETVLHKLVQRYPSNESYRTQLAHVLTCKCAWPLDTAN